MFKLLSNFDKRTKLSTKSIVMKTFKSIMILIFLALMVSSCGSGGGSKKADKMKEPVSQAEFEKLLSDYGIALYQGSEFVELKTGANSEITYVLKSDEEGIANKLFEHYKGQLATALTKEKGWVTIMIGSGNISYRTNDFSFVFGVTIFPKLSFGENTASQEYKYMIYFGDGAVSY
ncbi:MAG: hypothetical protein C0408_00695 [Odoribacter sp.]|nr:hypothetical protein [Odoribacter sp.]